MELRSSGDALQALPQKRSGGLEASRRSRDVASKEVERCAAGVLPLCLKSSGGALQA